MKLQRECLGIIWHADCSFEGPRLFIIYFTRSKYLDLKDEYRAQLEAAGFVVPGPDWEGQAGVQKSSQKLAHVASPDGSKKQKVEMAPEDEIDEEEQLDQQLNVVGPQRTVEQL